MKHSAPFTIVLVVWGFMPQNLMALDQKTINLRTEQLRKMSEIDRSRLNRNLEEFQKLNEPEKQHFRQLHQEFVDDGARGGGLTKLLQTYSVWVQTLPPAQRDELQREKVSSQRLALIRRFKEEQEQSGESSESHADPNPEEPHPQSSPNFGPRVALSLKDLRAVMAVLVARLANDKVRPEFNEPRLPEYLPIIHASVQSSGGSYREWPDEIMLKEMTATLGKESMQIVNKPDYKSKRDATIRLMLLGIMKQARESVRLPTEQEKMRILEELSPADRERIMSQPKDVMNWSLVRKYVESKGGDSLSDFKKIPEYHRQIEELFNRLEVPLPPRFLQKAKKANPGAPGSLESRGEGRRSPVDRSNSPKAN